MDFHKLWPFDLAVPHSNDIRFFKNQKQDSGTWKIDFALPVLTQELHFKPYAGEAKMCLRAF